ncbi:hypothetical protein MACK_002910 [Theileria orientalis]|uniref:Kelch domain-containing protein 4 n=1 Tax=Theileria orientalis TaxID=68886 RepID=A0A976ME54_THEOR|nr:hypothetical protein MACK_002910 [Theileria orientalis]
MGKKDSRSKKGEDGKESKEKKTKKGISKESTINNILKNLSAEILKRSEDKSNGRWVKLDSERPSPRAHSSFTRIQGELVVMFGGEFFDGVEVALYNDTFLYNLVTHEWMKLDSPSNPLPRCSHQALYYDNRIYIFGGEFNTVDQFRHFNDIHYLCLTTLRWNLLNVSGPVPTPRSGHRMVLWNDYWVLFGGFHDNGKECSYYNDLYYFDIKKFKWNKVNQAMFSNSLPEPRAGCVLLPLNDSKHLLMHGGFSKKDTGKNVSGTSYQDTWLIDMNSVLTNNANILVWSKVQSAKNAELSFETGISYLSEKDCGIIFGGVNDVDEGLSMKSTFTNKCYKLNLNQRKYNPIEIGCKDIKLEDIGGLSLTKTAPTPRMNANVALHNNVFYVYGGIVEIKSVEVTLSDMWALDLERNEWRCIDAGFENYKMFAEQVESEESGGSEDDLSMDSDNSETSMDSDEYEELDVDSSSEDNSSMEE